MTRICYLPHDENVYLKPNPQILIVDLNRPLREKKKKTPGRKKSSGITTEKPPYQKPSDNISYPQSESRSCLHSFFTITITKTSTKKATATTTCSG